MPNPAGTGLPNPHNYTVINFSGAWVVRDNVTGLSWQRDMMTATMTWEAARTYCEGLSFAFQDDWRLPSRIELVSLLDFTRDTPAIDITAFPGASSGSLWTSSTTPANRAQVYVVESGFSART